jgi:hypothetical protein
MLSKMEEEQCIICLEDNPKPTHNIFQCRCTAHLHDTCLQKWYKQHNECPICRKSVESYHTSVYTIIFVMIIVSIAPAFLLYMLITNTTQIG